MTSSVIAINKMDVPPWETRVFSEWVFFAKFSNKKTDQIKWINIFCLKGKNSDFTNFCFMKYTVYTLAF